MNTQQLVQFGLKSLPLRADIDGLRAIAVLVVVMYHAQLNDWSGGFVGVDVFFVISGYLIIPKIALNLSQNRFSLTQFFAGRARRLIPALVPVLAFCLLVAFLLLGEGALETFSQSLLGASTFFSNYVFLAQSGYFQRTSDTLLLLHTWSLGVEFQFYIITPLIFLLTYKHLNMKIVFLTLGAFSLLVSIMLVEIGSNRAFYGIVPRFWELALGGFIGLVSWKLPSSKYFGFLLRLVGIFAIGYSANQYSTAIPFPGVAAILPAIGAALVLIAPFNSKDPLYRLLSNKVMRWIGLRSYSIYLWHWPLIVTVNLAADRPSEGYFSLAVLLSFLIAEVSYRFVETPVRQKQFWRSPRRLAVLVVVPVIVIGSASSLVRTPLAEAARSVIPLLEYRILEGLSDGEREEYMLTVHTSKRAEGRITRGVQCSFDETKSQEELLSCLKSADLTNPVLVVGDSHGRDVFHALRTGFPSVDFMLLHQSGCAPADAPRNSKVRCFPGLHGLLEHVFDEIEVSTVVLASHWPLKGVENVDPTLSMLSRLNLSTVVIGPGPNFGVSVTSMLRRSGIRESQNISEIRLDMKEFKFDITKSDRELASKLAEFDMVYISKLNIFCEKETCLAFVPNQEKRLMFWDNQHLTISGIEWLGTVLATVPRFQTFFLSGIEQEAAKND